MPRHRKYADDAERQAAYRKRRASAASIPMRLQPLREHLANLRKEITSRRAAIHFQRSLTRYTLDRSSPAKLIELLNYIESELDQTGIRAKGARTPRL
jgi:hypothetical protein